MRITLGKAKELTARKAPAAFIEEIISRVVERLITSGKWKGSLHTLALTARYGEIALPPQYSAIEGIKVDGVVRPIVNLWYTYLPGKANSLGFSMTAVQNLDDGHAVMYSLPVGGRGYSNVTAIVTGGGGTGATVRLQLQDGSISGIDVDQPGSGYTSIPTITFTGDGTGASALATIGNGKLTGATLNVGGTLTLSYPGSGTLVLTLYGTDENYLPIELTMTGNSTVTNPFTHIDRVHREQGTVVMTLTHTAIDGSKTPLAILAPLDEENYLHRYFVETLANKPEATILALCKLRFRPFTSDQDILPFANISALELGMIAKNFEDENDLIRANEYWDAAIKVLNDEIRDARATDEYPVVRQIYPGGTTPNLHSFY